MIQPIWLLPLGLVGCTAFPLSPPTPLPAVYTVMQPVCLLFCSNPVSLIREDVDAHGAVTTGAKSSTQSGKK